MRKHILVVGYGRDHCPKEAYELAYRVGAEVSRNGVTLVTGGLGGVMEAASKGARDNNGLVVGIVPGNEKSSANEFCNVVIATGIGLARDFITAYTGDAVIVVGGGAGTMIEVCAAYLKSKPIVAIKGSGGTADKIADSFIDERNLTWVHGEKGPVEAVRRAMELAEQRTSSTLGGRSARRGEQ